MDFVFWFVHDHSKCQNETKTTTSASVDFISFVDLCVFLVTPGFYFTL